MLRILLLLSCAVAAAGANLRVTVKDPKGALVPGATVALRLSAGEPAVASGTTDGAGVAVLKDTAAGTYQLQVAKDGFEPFTRELVVETKDAEVTVELKLAVVETAVEVTGKVSAMANSDANYRALRGGRMEVAYRVNGLKFARDAGEFTFASGEVCFAAPVLGRRVLAVFSGSGTFHMVPPIGMEKDYLKMVTEKEAVDEEFDSAVLAFSDGTFDLVSQQGEKAAPSAKCEEILKRFRSHMRRSADIPRSFTEAMFHSRDVPNVDAELLAELYNPNRGASFRAFIHGRKHSDLRFILNPRGALPDLPSPEEVALVNVTVTEKEDGIWYTSHLLSEWKSNRNVHAERKQTVAPKHYRIETTIGRNRHLASVAEIAIEALEAGERVIPFGLLPSLRVLSVTLGGKEIRYVQEDRKQDGSFYAILPEAPAKGATFTLKIEYEGNRVIDDAGGGNFAVGARTSWYPSLNCFQQQATYHLVFKVPKDLTLASVGKLVRQGREDNYAVTEWKSEVPLAVAGFNYGSFKRKEVKDSATGYQIETYATSEMPGGLRFTGMTLTPSAMADNAAAETLNSIRVFSHWFGPAPYGRIAITQQPQFNFGQSWPGLVYLPVSAFLDSTQRWMLLGQNAFRFAHFIQEVTPHEVAHQWWGHMVGWGSYRDQWLSEGFADFSAGLYLQATEKRPDKFLQYWERGRKAILEENEFGRAPNDAGPLCMGFRLSTEKTRGAYNRLVYPKGGFVVHMLRQLMWNPKTGDEDFIALMRDFVKSNMYRTVSTQTFAETVQRHFKPAMDVDGSGNIAWFFRQWVFSTEVPAYRLDYSLKEKDGKCLLTGKITQSGVSNGFAMRVPVYAEFDGKPVRIGSLAMRGNSTSGEFEVLLPKKPKRVMLNAWHDVLARENVAKEM